MRDPDILLEAWNGIVAGNLDYTALYFSDGSCRCLLGWAIVLDSVAAGLIPNPKVVLGNKDIRLLAFQLLEPQEKGEIDPEDISFSVLPAYAEERFGLTVDQNRALFWISDQKSQNQIMRVLYGAVAGELV